jgi:four helix bundle protein
LKTYRDLKFWDRVHRLVVRIYEITRSYPKEELVNLTAAMRKSATAIGSTIVEGVALGSEREQLNLLHSAIGMTGQLEYQLLLSVDLGYLDDTTYDELTTELLDLRRQLLTHMVKVKTMR